MYKKIFLKIIFFIIILSGLQPKPLKADDGAVVVVAGIAAFVGATCIGYKAWQLYTSYTQERTFLKAKELLKKSVFWGNSETVYSANGKEIINHINELALQGYKPALYFQAEHPWLFVDSIISEFAPNISQPIFYARYARFSIEKYKQLAALGDIHCYFNAGNLGIAWLYIKYHHGVDYAQISGEIDEYLGYLDTAACLGHQGAVNEIVRIYQEGLLVKYNQRLIAEIPGYYEAIQKMSDSIYPISNLRIWLFKNYYSFLQLSPVAS